MRSSPPRHQKKVIVPFILLILSLLCCSLSSCPLSISHFTHFSCTPPLYLTDAIFLLSPHCCFLTILHKITGTWLRASVLAGSSCLTPLKTCTYSQSQDENNNVMSSWSQNAWLGGLTVLSFTNCLSHPPFPQQPLKIVAHIFRLVLFSGHDE